MKNNKIIIDKLVTHLSNLEDIQYSDLTDIGNEVGYAIGEFVNDVDMGYSKEEFIDGIKHGISLIDGTHG